MQPATQSGPRSAGARNTALLVIALSALWLTFSGKFDVVHLAYGVLSIGLVVLLSRNLVVAHRDPSQNQALTRLNVPRALVYPWWLVVQIIIANVQVSWIIIRPNMKIDPVLITFRTGMTSALAKVTLGNSIILTPGTFTLRIVDDRFFVHSIHESLATSLLDGTLQRKVGALFGEHVPEDLQIVVLRDAAAVKEEVERWSS